MEKVHNVSSVHSLTLEASQLRTKLSQCSCPPWVSAPSSGFTEFCCAATHRSRLSRKALGTWLSACQQLQLRPSKLLTGCTSTCEYMCEDQGAGLRGSSGQKSQAGSAGRDTRWELHTVVLGAFSLRYSCLHAWLSCSLAKHSCSKVTIC